MYCKHPKVSVGIPVYNGGKFIADTIESVLNQTFQDFELIISDNASTDATEEICRAYATQHECIRYYRNTVNLGLSRNFNRVFQLAKGEYVKLMAADDLCAPEFLEQCVDFFDQNPSAVLCYSRIQIVDSNLNYLSAEGAGINSLEANSTSPSKRFYELIRHNNHHHQGIEVYSLIRKSALDQTPLFGYYAHADRVFSARLGFLGTFHQIDKPLMFYRNHPGQASVVKKRRWFNLSEPTPHPSVWDPEKMNQLTFPEWRLNAEYLASINEASIGFIDRLVCYFYLLWRLLLHKNWARLVRDILIAVDKTVSGDSRILSPGKSIQREST